MTSAELLTSRDRCVRLAAWSQHWQWRRLSVPDSLRQAVHVGMTCESDDPGQVAGDELFTLASERGFETQHANVYELGMHYAALADITVTAVRRRIGRLYSLQGKPLGGNLVWESSALTDADSVRLRRIVLASRYTPERAEAEKHAWFSLGEVCAYEMPMTVTVCVIGQNREGRYHGPWSKAMQHPLNRSLKFRRKGGQAFKGEWKPVWREELDSPKETWLEAMQADGVLRDAMFEVEIPVPLPEVRQKVLGLAKRRLEEMQEMEATPPPSPSQCWFPTRCPFADTCWQYQREPSERGGYVRISGAGRTPPS